MYHALIEVVAKLPKQTQVFCGHEYTVKNLEFGLSIEPDNASTKVSTIFNVWIKFE